MSMLTTDPIADLLSRIRNAAAVGKRQIVVPHSTIKQRVAEQLQAAGYLADVKVTDAKPQANLEIVINEEGSDNTITEIVRLSKPGRRMYAKADEIPRIKNGRGIVLVSTSKGVMTGNEAKAQRLGGELICKVY